MLYILITLIALFFLGLWWEKRTKRLHENIETDKMLAGTDWIGQDQIDRDRLLRELSEDLPALLKKQAS